MVTSVSVCSVGVGCSWGLAGLEVGLIRPLLGPGVSFGNAIPAVAGSLLVAAGWGREGFSVF